MIIIDEGLAWQYVASIPERRWVSNERHYTAIVGSTIWLFNNRSIHVYIPAEDKWMKSPWDLPSDLLLAEDSPSDFVISDNGVANAGCNTDVTFRVGFNGNFYLRSLFGNSWIKEPKPVMVPSTWGSNPPCLSV